MRAKLATRGLHVRVLGPPEVVETAHRTGPSVALVIDLSSAGVGDADLLAAHLNVPLLAVDEEFCFLPHVDITVVERTSDAIALHSSNYDDAALAHAVVTPLTPSSAVEIQLEDQIVNLPDVVIRVRRQHTFLEIDATTTTGTRHFRGPRCRLEPVIGRFAIARDGAPQSELPGPLLLEVQTRRFTAHLHRP